MAANHLKIVCPSWLEDECLMIETSGEMPEVAMQESLTHLPPLSPTELDCLRAAVVLGYLRIIGRDLDHANLGQAHFRGLERARDNLARLMAFLGRVGWELPAATRQQLGAGLRAFLAAEEGCLAAGRAYASSQAQPLLTLLAELGLDSQPWRGLLRRMERLPVPDFKGLAALGRLNVAGATAKRRRRQEGSLVLEALGPGAGAPLAQVTLALLDPRQQEDPAALARAELVWALLDLPEVQEDAGQA
ncbi:MAG: hypothetical protein HY910_07885 [Desulfarculus sp.]|nr:hypothetical protein [Desulfarculus sp.]